MSKRKKILFRTVFIALACLWGNSTGPALSKDETVWHLTQTHRSLGTTEIYITPRLMRLDKGNSDIVVLYRLDEGIVHIFNPAHKAIFNCPLERFIKRGYIVTAAGLGPVRTWYPKESKNITYKGQPASIVEIYAHGRSRSGRSMEINCCEMKVLHSAENFAKVVSVIETIYAITPTGFVPIEVKLNYSQGGGELWFQTHESELKNRSQNSNFRLQTSKIVREKRTSDFFAVPKNFMVMKTDAEIMNLTNTASDLTNLILP